MKIFIKILYINLIVFLSAFSCKKDPIINPAKDLTGKWEWIFTYKALPLSDSNPLTPENTGVKEILIFNADRTWQKNQNDVCVDFGTYTLGHGSHAAYPGAHLFIYDSIVYYRDGIKVIGGQDYYEIFDDTLQFSPGFGGRLSSYTLPYNGAKFWIKKY